MARYPVAQNPGLLSRLRVAANYYWYGAPAGNKTQLSQIKSQQPWYGSQLTMPENTYNQSKQPISRSMSSYDQRLIAKAKELAAQGKNEQLQDFLTKRPDLRREVLGSLRSNASNEMIAEMLRKSAIEEQAVATSQQLTQAQLLAHRNLVNSVEEVIEWVFEDFAKNNVKISIDIANIEQTFPQKTWWEQITGDKESYSRRVYEWLFDPTRTEFYVSRKGLSDVEKDRLKKLWSSYMERTKQVFPNDPQGALAYLKGLVKYWDPIVGTGSNQPEVSRMGLEYFLKDIVSAIKENVTLDIFLDDAGVELSDLRYQHAVREFVRKIMNDLFNVYKNDVNHIVDDFIAREKQNLQRKQEYIEGLSVSE